MLSFEEAVARMVDGAPVMPVERVVLADAYDRVLAEDLVSEVAVPPWNNSAMDGYAVIAADTADGEVQLDINEIVGAGAVATMPVRPGTATGIMTGAPMPEGADTVVMIEHTDGARAGRVRIRGKARVAQHIRPRGAAMQPGEVVLTAGTVLTPAAVGLVASVGIAEVPVRRRPLIGVLSTGDEVVPAGRPLGPGQIYSSNNATLVGYVRQAGGVAVDGGNAPDDLPVMIDMLADLADRCDAVMTTGGVSMGMYDQVRDAYAAIGAELDFWKIAVKPGKPLAFGQVDRKGRVVPLFGLPGNPVSCAVGFLEYVGPWIRRALGRAEPYLPVVDAVAEAPLVDRSKRPKLLRVALRRDADGTVRCRPAGDQSSGVLTAVARGHGLAMVPGDVPRVEPGQRVTVQIYDAGFLASAEPPRF